MGKQFWVAQTITPNFKLLAEAGFVILYPSLEDYVFLEVAEENKKWFGRQKDLGVKFQESLDKKEVMTVSEEEVETLKQSLRSGVTVGGKVKIVGGVYDGMKGDVLEEGSDSCRVEVKGFARTYDVWILKVNLEEDK